MVYYDLWDVFERRSVRKVVDLYCGNRHVIIKIEPIIVICIKINQFSMAPNYVTVGNRKLRIQGKTTFKEVKEFLEKDDMRLVVNKTVYYEPVISEEEVWACELFYRNAELCKQMMGCLYPESVIDRDYEIDGYVEPIKRARVVVTVERPDEPRKVVFDDTVVINDVSCAKFLNYNVRGLDCFVNGERAWWLSDACSKDLLEVEFKPVVGMHVVVKTLTQKSFTIGIESHDTIGTLKKYIEAMEGIPVEQQRYIFIGRALDDRLKLVDYKIKMGSIVQLVLRLRGGMHHFTSGRDDYVTCDSKVKFVNTPVGVKKITIRKGMTRSEVIGLVEAACYEQ